MRAGVGDSVGQLGPSCDEDPGKDYYDILLICSPWKYGKCDNCFFVIYAHFFLKTKMVSNRRGKKVIRCLWTKFFFHISKMPMVSQTIWKVVRSMLLKCTDSFLFTFHFCASLTSCMTKSIDHLLFHCLPHIDSHIGSCSMYLYSWFEKKRKNCEFCPGLSSFWLTVTNPQHHDSSLCLKSRGFSEMNCPGQLKINVICYLFLIITLMYFILWMYHINVNTVVAGSSNGEVIRA